ncbi:MAG: hypothetical protein CMJ83_18480 [Planctomycetes bacterium]|nr:hypothetical protein [Planctomycetota bacterium]
MRWRYVRFDPRRHGREERFKHLRTVFNQLLLETGGDADDAMRWLDRLGERYGWFDGDYSIDDFRADLERSGDVARDPGTGGGLRLTGRGERGLRREALERIFTGLAAMGAGDHRTHHGGGDGEETDELRAYSFGDPIEQIAWTPTLRNALARSAGEPGRDAPGHWSLREEDFEIRERERSVGCATVLLVDVSHSMILYGEDRMTPAREVALALLELITTRFRKDTLDLVLFGDDAERVELRNIPYIDAGPFHTNTKAGLKLAQEILHSRRNVNKQIFMITDGKPSCIWKQGSLYKNPFGLDDEIRNRTLDEALRCRKAGIAVTTFMVARDPILVDFVDEFTQLCRGKAYFTGTEGLGAALFVDYMRNRQSRIT